MKWHHVQLMGYPKGYLHALWFQSVMDGTGRKLWCFISQWPQNLKLWPLSKNHEEPNCRTSCIYVFLWTRRFVSKCQLKNSSHITFWYVFSGAKHGLRVEPNDTMWNLQSSPGSVCMHCDSSNLRKRHKTLTFYQLPPHQVSCFAPCQIVVKSSIAEPTALLCSSRPGDSFPSGSWRIHVAPIYTENTKAITNKECIRPCDSYQPQ